MSLTRRDALKGAAFLGGLGLFGGAPARHAVAAPAAPTPSSFSYCLNIACIRGQRLGVVKEFETAAEAGYTGIEPWTGPLMEYEAGGNSVADLAARMKDWGLTIESAIGFAPWIVNDDAQRAGAFEQMKREMDLLKRLGGKRIAAPPAGATRNVVIKLDDAAQRYHDLLELGREMGVTPQLEIWGPSENLHKMSQAAYVLAGCGHPDACILPDVYHLYKGGSDIDSLRLFGAEAIQVFHMNDYPADPPIERIGDGDRVMPGDGIAPLDTILRYLRDAGGPKVLSLEIFHRGYWEQDALEVAKLGLRKMKDAVAAIE
jgi:2-keto-myo-inositol isomerase